MSERVAVRIIYLTVAFFILSVFSVSIVRTVTVVSAQEGPPGDACGTVNITYNYDTCGMVGYQPVCNPGTGSLWDYCWGTPCANRHIEVNCRIVPDSSTLSGTKCETYNSYLNVSCGCTPVNCQYSETITCPACPNTTCTHDITVTRAASCGGTSCPSDHTGTQTCSTDPVCQCPGNGCQRVASGCNENCSSCPQDCGACCGNGLCQTNAYGENCNTCPTDCPCSQTCCPDGTCAASAASCSAAPPVIPPQPTPCTPERWYTGWCGEGGCPITSRPYVGIRKNCAEISGCEDLSSPGDAWNEPEECYFPPGVLPTVTLTVNPTSHATTTEELCYTTGPRGNLITTCIPVPVHSDLRWTTEHAVSCSKSNTGGGDTGRYGNWRSGLTCEDWSGALSLDGYSSEATVCPQAPSTTYTLTCTNPYGSDTATATVTIGDPIPTVTLEASPNPTPTHNTELTWEVSGEPATSCTATGDPGADGNWTGSKAFAPGEHTEDVTVDGNSDTYSIYCTGTNGDSAPASVPVTYIAPPTPPECLVTLTKDPQSPTCTDLDWEVQNVVPNSCVADFDPDSDDLTPFATGEDDDGTTGLLCANPGEIATYTLACDCDTGTIWDEGPDIPGGDDPPLDTWDSERHPGSPFIEEINPGSARFNIFEFFRGLVSGIMAKTYAR